jgi:hypothetical protein
LIDAALQETTSEPSEPWYEKVGAQARLMQGDIILNCPLLTWADVPAVISGIYEAETLMSVSTAFKADVVVMTQACDLEQEKVTNVVLCPHISLTDYRVYWENDVREKGQNPTAKAWRTLCEDIKDGYVWNLSVLNSHADDELGMELRIVDFHELFTVPRIFVESMIDQRKTSRLRLRPPYREHLSQAFARYFMRVGLPTPIQQAW